MMPMTLTDEGSSNSSSRVIPANSPAKTKNRAEHWRSGGSYGKDIWPFEMQKFPKRTRAARCPGGAIDTP